METVTYKADGEGGFGANPTAVGLPDSPPPAPSGPWSAPRLGGEPARPGPAPLLEPSGAQWEAARRG